MPSPARLAAAALGAGAVGVGAAALAERRWRAADDPAGPEGLARPEGEDIKVTTDDGAVLAATVAGEGPSVVLTHCWTGNRSVWAPVARRLVERGRRVVLYDQRGHGESTRGSADLTIERLGADLRTVLEDLDVTDAVVAGHSLGGMSVQAFAIEHPEVARHRVRRLVLVATAAAGVAPIRPLAAAVIGRPLVDRALRSRRGHALVRGTLGRDVSRANLVAVRDCFVATPADIRLELLTAMHEMDLRADLDRIDLPTTVVIGLRDRLVPPRLGRSLARALPEARLVELQGAGHMLPLENPDKLTELLEV